MRLPILPKNMQQLQSLTRQQMRLLWQLAQTGAPLEDEHARLIKIMREHPEYADLWGRLDELSDTEIERDGVNPILHVQMHAAVENQIALRDPDEVRVSLKALLRQGYDRHEAIHVIASALLEEIFPVLKEQHPFNEAHYLRKLRKLAHGKRA